MHAMAVCIRLCSAVNQAEVFKLISGKVTHMYFSAGVGIAALTVVVLAALTVGHLIKKR